MTLPGRPRSLLTDHRRRRSTIFGWAPRSAPQPEGEAEKDHATPTDAVAGSLPDVPPDVVALLEWAHMEGVPYRDFSALRREYRAGMRHRAALARRDVEAEAKAKAEQAAAEADHASREAGEAARLHAAEARRAMQRQQRDQAAAAEAARERALLHADQLSRRAAAERMEAARHAEALRAAEQTARREVLELTRARAAAERGPEAGTPYPAAGSRPVMDSPKAGSADLDGMNPLRVPSGRDARHLYALGNGLSPAEKEGEPSPLATIAAEDLAPVLLTELSASETAEVVERFARSMREFESPTAVEAPETLEALTADLPGVRPRAEGAPLASPEPPGYVLAEEDASPEAPSWITERATPMGEGRSALRETLQHSRESVASRWYALRRLFGSATPEDEPAELDAEGEAAPILAIYSIAGGVGKTSLAASLTRALAARGERVLLVDTTGRGILPYYLGARDPRAEEMRTFAPPQGSTEQPIHLMTPGAAAEHEAGEKASVARVRAAAAEFSRVVVDVAPGDVETLRELVKMGAEILVPVAPDMNSAVSLPALKRLFASARSGADVSVRTAYLMTQFDPSQPLQLDVRELFQQQLGDSLLPFALRRSPAVAEALAEGMTVVDYAPGEGVTKDVLQLATWVRRQAGPAREGFAQARWSER